MDSLLQIFGLQDMIVAPLTMIFLINDDEVLTLHRAPTKAVYPDRISGFGGKVEPGETLEASAIREFKEETNLDIVNPQLRGVFTRALDHGYVNYLYIFVATSYSGDLKTDSDEGTVSWRKIGDFLADPKTVDHIKLYFEQVVKGENFYTGIGYYKNGVMEDYADTSKHYALRKSV